VLLEDSSAELGFLKGTTSRSLDGHLYYRRSGDGYRGVSLAELDSGILESEVIVADTMDSAPLAAKQGPFRL